MMLCVPLDLHPGLGESDLSRDVIKPDFMQSHRKMVEKRLLPLSN